MWEGLVGLKFPSLVAAFFGSVVSFRFIRAETWLGRLLLLMGGFGGAAFGTPLILHVFEWPLAFEGGAAFLLGMFGMAICDAFVRTIAAADIWSVIRGWLERR